MLQLFSESAKALFAERMLDRFPGFKLKKSRKGNLRAAAYFERRISANAVAWIGFTGFKERDITVEAAWTASNIPLKELKEWERCRNPRAFEIPPRPTDGYVDLHDRWRFEPGTSWHYENLSLPEPGADFSKQVFESYISSPAFDVDFQQQMAGARRLYTQNIPSEDEIKSDLLGAERAYCQLWSHLASRYQFTNTELRDLVTPVVNKAIGLVEQYGMPLLHERVGA